MLTNIVYLSVGDISHEADDMWKQQQEEGL